MSWQFDGSATNRQSESVGLSAFLVPNLALWLIVALERTGTAVRFRPGFLLRTKPHGARLVGSKSLNACAESERPGSDGENSAANRLPESTHDNAYNTP
jgi:hypothetical protein